MAKANEGYEPLHAIYWCATCFPAIEATIASDKWRMDSWFPQIKIRRLTSDEIKRYDLGGLAISNINTAGDFAQDERRASGQPTPGTERD